MSLLWDRKASVTFGPKGGTGIKVSDLRVSFDVEKTSESNPNKAKIQIYNLSEASRGILKTKESQFILLEIGYGDVIDQLFIGDVERSFTQRSGADFVTTIEAADGGQALNESKIDKSYSAGVKLKTVIDDAMQAMKDTGQIVVGSLTNIKDEVAQNGITVSGLAKKVIDNISNKMGLEFSVQDNEAVILDPAVDTGELEVLLTPTTGLIGSPQLGKIDEKVEGVEFKALIQTTKFRPGRAVKLEAKDIDGLIRVIKAKFIGDTHATAWFVTCEGTLL